MRFSTDRRYLARALGLGFREFFLTKPGAAIACHGQDRQFGWMPLGEENPVEPADDAIRIESPSDDSVAVPTNPKPKRKPTTMPRTNASTNGQPVQPKPEAEGVEALIEEAEALKAVLKDAAARAGELIASLKRHRKQARAVQTTLASLRELQTIAG